MIYELDNRHIAIMKFEGGLWYGVRRLEQSDLSGIHMSPVPLTCADRRVMHQGEQMAADLLMAPITQVDKIRYGLSQERFDEINTTIRERLQTLRGHPLATPKPALTSTDFLKLYEAHQAAERFEQPYFDYNVAEIRHTILDGLQFIAGLERDIAIAKKNDGFIMDCGEKVFLAELEGMLVRAQRQKEIIQPVIDMVGDMNVGWIIFENNPLDEEASQFVQQSYAFSDSDWFGKTPVWITPDWDFEDKALHLLNFLNGCALTQHTLANQK